MNTARNVNIIDEPLLRKFKESLGQSIESAITIADKEVKTVDLTLKISVSVENEVIREEGFVKEEYNAPKVDYKVSRVIKESKFDYSGKLPEKIELKYDGDGHVILINKDDQIEIDLDV